jgi:hypothetical protein
MPDDIIQIESYTYHCLSSRDEDEVKLYLYDGQTNLAATVLIVPDDRPMPPAERQGRRYTLYYRRDVFRHVLDMLRNEGPVQLVWRDSSNVALGTGLEPVGEGEAAA